MQNVMPIFSDIGDMDSATHKNDSFGLTTNLDLCGQKNIDRVT